jgi:cation:H+ antiporter
LLFSSFLVLLGIALLYYGGESLVDNAILLARRFGVSQLVIGLTVVAFATSAPELATSLIAAFGGSPDIAIGNVLGSNIANLGLILGSAALIFPLAATARFIRREVVFMILITACLYPLMSTGLVIGRLEGLGLFLLLIGFLVISLRDPGNQEEVTGDDEETSDKALWLIVLGISIGVALLVGGAHALVEGASAIARSYGVPERVIGATLVALGTSLPELAASVVAARRHQGDLVLGNVIGSNIFNLLCILGLTSLVHPIAINIEFLRFDFWVTLGISILVFALLAVRKKLSRAEGGVLLVMYFGYLVFLFLNSGA